MRPSLALHIGSNSDSHGHHPEEVARIDDGDDSYLKTCAWLSFGVDAGRAMYSGFEAVLEKAPETYVLPIFVFGQVPRSMAKDLNRFVQELRITNEKGESTYTQLLIKQTGLIESDVATGVGISGEGLTRPRYGLFPPKPNRRI